LFLLPVFLVNKDSQNYVPSMRKEKTAGAGHTPRVRTHLEPINVYAMLSTLMTHGGMVSSLLSVRKPATFRANVLIVSLFSVLLIFVCHNNYRRCPQALARERHLQEHHFVVCCGKPLTFQPLHSALILLK